LKKQAGVHSPHSVTMSQPSKIQSSDWFEEVLAKDDVTGKDDKN